jgi:hypothetical protein
MANDQTLYLDLRAARARVDGQTQYGHGEFTDGEAAALGRLLKRLVFPDYRRNAKDDAEAYLMGSAMSKLRHLLADAGITQGALLGTTTPAPAPRRRLGPPGQTGDLFQDFN